jgi:hypothetical protein
MLSADVWASLIAPDEWESIAASLKLSTAQALFLWHALHDSHEQLIAQRMSLTSHGAHAHRMAVYRKLQVDCMPAAIARIFAAYIRISKAPAGGMDARHTKGRDPAAKGTLE